MRYKHLFFDLDHTLWDFELNAKETLQELFDLNDLSGRGIESFDFFFDRYSYHNERLWERYTRGFIKQEELRWKRMWLSLLDCKITDEPLARKMAVQFLEKLPSRTNLFPYTVEILEYLQEKKYKLHLITNGFDEVQHGKLRSCNIHVYFGHVITSECSNSLKPNREIFDFALKTAGTTPDESLMIGDNIEADILGGMKAGMDTVYVNHLKVEVPKGVQPTYIIHHLKELEDIL